MSVTTEETNRVTTTGDGSTTVFSYTFTLLDKDDLTVVLTTIATGAEETLTRISDYTVDLTAKTVTTSFARTPTATEKITLARNTLRVQEVEYRATRPIVTATHERVYDRLTLIQQDQQDETDRQMIGGVVETSPLVLEQAATRASRFLQFDGSGDPSSATSVTTITPDAFWTT